MKKSCSMDDNYSFCSISCSVRGPLVLFRKATPTKCLDLDDTSGQLKQEGWLYIVLILYALFNEEAPFYWQFGRGGTILLVILERRPFFISYLSEEAPFCWANLGGGWGSILFMSKTMLEVGWSFILWSMLYMEGWSSRSSYFLSVA